MPISKVTMMELLIDASVAASKREVPARTETAERQDSYFNTPSSELAGDCVSLEMLRGDEPDLVIALVAQLDSKGEDRLAVFVHQIEAFLEKGGAALKREAIKGARQSDFIYPVH